ncbi:thioesterase II family protein [Streptomyces sp. NPDC001594]|uniref:thioesterase II family protein n=1 Tax=Streptomyces sp. NPDC001594 TaxID=3364590 RepID=UPI00368AD31B
MTSVPVVCFPPAGAGPSFFQQAQGRSELLDLRPVDLPGKEALFTELPAETIPELVEAVLPAVRAALGDAPRAALFGHCFGAVVAYETAQALLRDGHRGELVLFASGSHPPGVPNAVRLTGLSDEEFIAGVRRIADYDHPALDDLELRELLLPALRADIAAHESYAPAWPDVLPAPVVAVRGADDALVSAASSSGWAAVTSGGFVARELPGTHMYPTDDWSGLSALIERELLPARATSSTAGNRT